MFDWGSCDMIMWQTCRDRQCEAERNRLARKARSGHRRRFHLLVWARAGSERRPSVLGTARQDHVRRAVEESVKVSSSGGGLML